MKENESVKGKGQKVQIIHVFYFEGNISHPVSILHVVPENTGKQGCKAVMNDVDGFFCRYQCFSSLFYFWKRFFSALPVSINCSDVSGEIRELEKVFFDWDLIWSAIILELSATTASCKPLVDSCKAT